MSSLSIATSLAGCCADGDPNGRNDERATRVMRKATNDRDSFLIMMRSVRVSAVRPSGRDACEACRFVDAPGALIARDLWIRTKRTRSRHFPIEIGRA